MARNASDEVKAAKLAHEESDEGKAVRVAYKEKVATQRLADRLAYTTHAIEQRASSPPLRGKALIALAQQTSDKEVEWMRVHLNAKKYVYPGVAARDRLGDIPEDEHGDFIFGAEIIGDPDSGPGNNEAYRSFAETDNNDPVICKLDDSPYATIDPLTVHGRFACSSEGLAASCESESRSCRSTER